MDRAIEACSTCRFGRVSSSYDDVPFVKCRRYPPTPLAHSGETIDERPCLLGAEWCGEYDRDPRWGP